MQNAYAFPTAEFLGVLKASPKVGACAWPSHPNIQNQTKNIGYFEKTLELQ